MNFQFMLVILHVSVMWFDAEGKFNGMSKGEQDSFPDND